MLILWYFEYTTVVKISENETALNFGICLQWQTQLKPKFKAVLLIKVWVIM